MIDQWLFKGDDNQAKAGLRQHVDANNSNEWVRTISNFYLGTGTMEEQAVLAEAKKGNDDKGVRERLSEAYYYLGIKRLVADDREGATEFFAKSVEMDAKNSIGYGAAKAMLAYVKQGTI